MKKNLLPFLMVLLLASCSPKEKTACEFSIAHITSGEIGNDAAGEDYTIKDCFRRAKPDANGLVEIKGDKTEANFKAFYQDEPAGISVLTLKFKNNSSDWRKSQGHDILKVEKKDTLMFNFADRLKSKVKGTAVFIK